MTLGILNLSVPTSKQASYSYNTTLPQPPSFFVHFSFPTPTDTSFIRQFPFFPNSSIPSQQNLSLLSVLPRTKISFFFLNPLLPPLTSFAFFFIIFPSYLLPNHQAASSFTLQIATCSFPSSHTLTLFLFLQLFSCYLPQFTKGPKEKSKELHY